MNILLIEDCQEVAEVIFDYFEHSPFEFDYAANGIHGLELAQQGDFDCIILDIMLPGLSGINVCQQLRALGIDTPIIMLTARDTNQDMLLGLREGADDYIVKPFDLELLEARIASVLRRTSGSGFKTQLTCGDLTLDLKTRQVWRAQQPITLNHSGFQILKLLIENYPGVATKQMIEQMLWQNDVPDQDILRKHIYQLRLKVDKPFNKEIIKTVPKMGYKLER